MNDAHKKVSATMTLEAVTVADHMSLFRHEVRWLAKQGYVVAPFLDVFTGIEDAMEHAIHMDGEEVIPRYWVENSGERFGEALLDGASVITFAIQTRRWLNEQEVENAISNG